MDQTDLIITNRTFYPKNTEHTVFSSVHGVCSRTAPCWAIRASLRKFKIIEIIPGIFSDHQGMKLEINTEGTLTITHREWTTSYWVNSGSRKISKGKSENSWERMKTLNNIPECIGDGKSQARGQFIATIKKSKRHQIIYQCISRNQKTTNQTTS